MMVRKNRYVGDYGSSEDAPVETAPPQEALKVGDVVYVKSGSPGMTVDKVTEDGKLEVCWMYEGRVLRATFPTDVLTTKEPKS